MMKRIAATVGVTAFTSLLLWAAVSAGPQQAVELTSAYTAQAPVVDGSVDAVWEDAGMISVPVVGGANAGSHTVTIKSLYTDQDVYLLVQWTDPTESLRRFPWVKQDDGSWAQLNDGSNHDETQFYEDKLAMIWSIENSISGFESAGCFVACHAGEPNKAYGNKYTATPGERGDIWHWKSVRTNPAGYADDQYVDDTRWSEDTPEAGRHADPKDSGSYVNNKNDAGDAPAFTAPQGTAPPYWVLDSEKVPFVDTFQPGDEIPGIIVNRATGDRGDIDAKGVYTGDGWTLELRRARVTGSDKDIQFDDLAQTYHFGVAVFDNAQVRHSFQTGATAFRFGAAPTAVAQSSWAQIKQLIR